MNVVAGVLLGLGFILVSFSIWRKMRGDYNEEEILTLTIVLGMFAWVASWGWRWWSVGGVLAAVILGLIAWCGKRKWDVWEWLDVVVPATLVMGVAVTLGRGLWVSAALLLLGWGVSWLTAKFYRSWRWYESGKRGLVGLIGLMAWMVVWMTIAKLQPLKIYWAGVSLEQWLAIWVVIALGATAFVRSGRKITWPRK